MGSRLALTVLGALVGAGLGNATVRRKLADLLWRTEGSGTRDLVAFVPHPSGQGGWTLDRRGNIFALGSAPEFREIPEPDPWREAAFVAMACTPSGRGLWTLNASGNIYSYGDAPEFREVPHPDPWRAPFVAIASTASGRGVWTVDRMGNVFAFGDAIELREVRPSP